MISQIRQGNKRTHIVQNGNQRCQNLEIDKNSAFYYDIEKIVLDRGIRSHPFSKNKTQVTTKASKTKKRSSLSKESSRINSSTQRSHTSEPEPIFDEEKIAELLELVESMKIASSKKKAATGEISSFEARKRDEWHC